MATTKQQKLIKVMKKLLEPLGWANAGYSFSGVLMKNGVYFFAIPTTQEYSSKTVEGNVVGALEPMVHGSFDGWYLTKDGFLIGQGSYKRYLTKFAEEDFSGTEGEEAKEFAKTIDSFANLSDVEVLKYKYREEQGVGDKKLVAVKAFDLGKVVKLSSSLVFALNPAITQENVLGMFKGNIYHILEITGGPDGKTKVAPYLQDLTAWDENQSVLVPTEIFAPLWEQNLLEAMIIREEDAATEVQYKLLNSGVGGANLGEEFDEFHLSNEQKAIVSGVMADGYNFTPVLENRLSVQEMTTIAKIIRSGIDCSGLCGVEFSLEYLEFFQVLARNKLPLKLFLNPNENLDLMKRRFEGMSEMVDKSISDFEPETKLLIKQAIFEQRPYEHLTREEDSLLRKKLLDERYKRFHYLADILLKRGVESGITIMIPWISLSEDEKTEVLKHFRSFGAVCQGRDFDDFLEEFRERFSNLYFMSDRQFYLNIDFYLIGSDYNSIKLTDLNSSVLWRTVLVNGKHRYYYNKNLKFTLPG